MMQRQPAAAIATLVRWREFAQECASTTLMSRSAEVAQARSCVESAEKSVDATRTRINGLLTDRHIDLARLQMLSDIEANAWSHTQTVRDQLVQALARQDEARLSHGRARAQTRVATARQAQVVQAHCEFEEKQAFDRMAELYRPRAGRIG